MNKKVKGALIFTGGVVSGITLSGYAAVQLVVKNETFRKVVKTAISNIIAESLVPTKPRYRKYDRVNYVSYRKTDDVIFENRAEVESVLDKMSELLKQQGFVSRAEFYNMGGVGVVYEDHTYGWTNLDDAKVVRVRDGYILKLPRVVPVA